MFRVIFDSPVLRVFEALFESPITSMQMMMIDEQLNC